MGDFLSGILFGVWLILIVIIIVPSANERALVRCKDAVLVDIPVIWQEDYPFCKVEVTINGEIKEVTLKDFYKYTK